MTSTDLKSRAKELWHEGGRRRFRLYKGEKDLVSVPLNIAVILALCIPGLVIGGALLALLAGYSAEIQLEDGDSAAATTPPVEPVIPHDDI